MQPRGSKWLSQASAWWALHHRRSRPRHLKSCNRRVRLPRGNWAHPRQTANAPSALSISSTTHKPSARHPELGAPAGRHPSAPPRANVIGARIEGKGAHAAAHSHAQEHASGSEHGVDGRVRAPCPQRAGRHPGRREGPSRRGRRPFAGCRAGEWALRRRHECGRPSGPLRRRRVGPGRPAVALLASEPERNAEREAPVPHVPSRGAAPSARTRGDAGAPRRPGVSAPPHRHRRPASPRAEHRAGPPMPSSTPTSPRRDVRPRPAPPATAPGAARAIPISRPLRGTTSREERETEQ
jgi:hypothetical protein